MAGVSTNRRRAALQMLSAKVMDLSARSIRLAITQMRRALN